MLFNLKDLAFLSVEARITLLSTFVLCPRYNVDIKNMIEIFYNVTKPYGERMSYECLMNTHLQNLLITTTDAHVYLLIQ